MDDLAHRFENHWPYVILRQGGKNEIELDYAPMREVGRSFRADRPFRHGCRRMQSVDGR